MKNVVSPLTSWCAEEPVPGRCGMPQEHHQGDECDDDGKRTASGKINTTEAWGVEQEHTLW